jgi:hypothetical protein
MPAVLWLVAALLAAGCFGQPALMELATNADALLPGAFVWEAINHPESWRGFEWPRIPSLVPDGLIYGVLQALSGSWRMAQLVYAIISLAGLAGLAGHIGRRLGGLPWSVAANLFLAATAIVFVVAAASDAGAWHLHLLVPAYHSGPLILSVACLALAPRDSALRDKAPRVKALGAAPWRCAALLSLSCAGTFSDKLFIGFFLLPLLAALLALLATRALTRRHAGVVALLGITGCALGLLADRLVFPGLLLREADVALLPLAMLARGRAFLATPYAYAALALNAAMLLPFWREKIRGEQLFWWVAGASATVPTTILAALLWENAESQRYLGALMWWPLLLWAPGLARLLPERMRFVLRPASIAVALLSAVGLSGGHPPGSAMVEWKDRLTSCVARTGREAGLADYLVARRMTMASDWTMQVEQIDRAGAGRVWGNNPRWFNADHTDPRRPPAFSFIVMTHLDQTAIRTFYGAPDGILRCPGDHLVWLYEDQAAMRRHFAAASPQRLQPGEARCVGPAALLSAEGALQAAPLQARAQRAASKPLTWGPYLDLPAGEWRIRLRYRLDAGEARWGVSALQGALRLHDGILPATENGAVETDLHLNRLLQGVEVRSFIKGAGAIEVLGVDFLPLDWAGASARCPASAF